MFWLTRNDAGQSCLADRSIRTLGRLSTTNSAYNLGTWKAPTKMHFRATVFSTKVLIEDAIFTGPPFHVVIRAKV